MIPTAPGRLPGIGHLLPLLSRPLPFMRSLAGTGEIVCVHLGRLPVYAVTSPRLVHRVLTAASTEVDKGRLTDKARPLLGNGLITSSGRFHRDQRRLVQPAFHPSRIAGYATTMSEAAHRIAGSWRPGQTVDVVRAMDMLTVSVVAQTLFSTHPGTTVIDDIGRGLPRLARGSAIRGLLPEYWHRLPTIGNRRYAATAARLRDVINTEITAHRRAGSDSGDVLSALLAARDPDTGAGMSDATITDEVTTLMLAATETTRATLVSTFAVLGQRPDIEHRVHAEVDQVLHNGHIRPNDLARLPYTRAVLTETMRMFPFLFLMRRTLRPLTLDGITLPAGAEIIYSPYALHHDPRWYRHPDTFTPDRWLPGTAGAIPPGAFVPFSAGSRKCIGDTFAITEATITVATIAARWRLRPLPNSKVRLTALPMIHPGRLRMTAQPRQR